MDFFSMNTYIYLCIESISFHRVEIGLAFSKAQCNGYIINGKKVLGEFVKANHFNQITYLITTNKIVKLI